MNKLSVAKRAQILAMLCEGSSMRAISRVADVSFNTVAKILDDAGEFCAKFHDEKVRNVRSQRVQCDEIWSFTYAKARNVAGAKAAPYFAGDTWTWTGIDADSKLIISYLVGTRDAGYAEMLIRDLQSRLANCVQLTTDGLRAYLGAVENTLFDVDFAQLVKLYGAVPEGAQGRYSPAECIGARKVRIMGDPDLDHVSTSYAERQNLTMRMHNRRFTRLTNAFSKRVESHFHSLAIYFLWYNFIRIHKSLRVTPAMAAGITDRLWTFEEILEMMDAGASVGKRGPYKKKISN
jgi:IS1 family transposase